MNIELIFKKAAESGFSASEVYILEKTNNSVSTCDGSIDSHKISTSKAISFRGLVDGKMGYAYSEKFDDCVVDQLIQTAKDAALLIEKEEQEFIYSGSSDYTKIEETDSEIISLSPVELENMALKFESILKEKVHKVASAKIYLESGKNQIINSYGLNLQEEKTAISAYIVAVLKESDNEYVNGFSAQVGTYLNKIDLEKVASEALKDASNQLQATRAKSGKYKVILENLAFASLLATMSPSFYADVMQKGKSKLKGLENTQIASEIVTIEDDPHFANSPGSCGFDAEGVRTYKKTIIENGIFKGFLHNLSTANKDGVESTGNASKASIVSPIRVSSTNLVVKSGELSLDQLIEKAENGLYITELVGLHSGANSISADFSLSAKGLLIENGKLTKGVKQIIVSGNFFDLLKNITDIADDFIMTYKSIATASVLVSELSVAGE
ncbi:MAG: hypothetical protein ATN31_09875 [Candidatus Epulonipiscioides saccharophilum]|nr:MAG: hypothetical protein ATN31_09875 [Epulopiscium sp. AS2M-Bin001]